MLGIAGFPATSIVNPITISSLKAWWDFRRSSGANGGACTGVADLSGTGNDLIATSPNRPINKDNYTKGGQRSVYYPPVATETDYLAVKTGPTPTKLACPNGYSLFITFGTLSTNTTSANPNVNPPNTYIGDINPDASGCYCNFGLSSGNVNYCYFDGAGAGWTTYASTGLNLNNGTLHTIGVSHTTDGIIKVFADGVVVNSSTSASVWSPTGHGMSMVGIGFNTQDQSNDASMSEALVWDGALSESEMLRMHQRSRSVYGTMLYL